MSWLSAPSAWLDHLLDEVPLKRRCRSCYQRKLTRCFGSACDTPHEPWNSGKETKKICEDSLMLLRVQSYSWDRMCTCSSSRRRKSLLWQTPLLFAGSTYQTSEHVQLLSHLSSFDIWHLVCFWTNLAQKKTCPFFLYRQINMVYLTGTFQKLTWNQYGGDL